MKKGEKGKQMKEVEDKLVTPLKRRGGRKERGKG